MTASQSGDTIGRRFKAEINEYGRIPGADPKGAPADTLFFLLEMQNETRVGLGYDSHRLETGRPLIIGGVAIPFEKGLAGHSDGDVLLHAMGDAICGAAGLPDIGMMFPDTDPEWRGADSWELLAAIANRAAENGWQLGNIDAILVAQKPKIAPFVGAMRERVAAALRSLRPEEELETRRVRVNIRGKTAENMGPIGAGEGMEAHAVCVLFPKKL